MLYSEFALLYENLALTSKRLEKIKILADFIGYLKNNEEFIYLLKGKVFPDYDSRETGVSTQLIIKSIAKSTGNSIEKINDLFKKNGDLGDVVFFTIDKSKQKSLLSVTLTVSHVLNNIRKLSEIVGDGAINKRVSIISEMLINSKPIEARYIVRTILGDLRIGVADAVILEAINSHFFHGDKQSLEIVQKANDLVNDFAEIIRLCKKGIESLNHVSLVPGRPVNVMLPIKVLNIQEAFDVCGRPAAFEHKYDGFRTIISSDGKQIKIFTRRLEDVTNQFPDLVSFVKEGVIAKRFILDGEAVGYDFSSGKYLPFESVSQRIKRKYHIEELAKKIPVELNVFDILYFEGNSTIDLSFKERREILTKIIRDMPKKIRLSTQVITDSDKEAEIFYKNALKIGEEGIMIKNMESKYVSGRYVGNIAKLKPVVEDLDVVIVGAEYGTGKRSGGLTSFIIAVKNGDKFVEVGKVSSGLKEKESEGTSYKEIDNLLQPLIISEDSNSVKVKPTIVVSVTYQNIQPSPSYSSGYALRFPRINHYRPERGIHDIASLDDIKNEVVRMSRKINKKAL